MRELSCKIALNIQIIRDTYVESVLLIFLQMLLIVLLEFLFLWFLFFMVNPLS
jgi:hypothetical protein